ncbi:MAG: metallophosphoesterase [Actinobacteria bacterium]|nr:metallophosphoesterase [Actinomycetota bacterium]
MIFVSDIHGATEPLRRLVALDDEIVVLGDFINLTDYRSGEGAVAEVLGRDFALETAEARGRSDYHGMRRMWRNAIGDHYEQVREQIGEVIRRQYVEVAHALDGGRGLAIHGNVDRPGLLRELLPEGFRYMHGEVVERYGLSIGFVGGGIPTPLQAEGEVSDEEMRGLLAGLGPVDVLCTHVPPAVSALRKDVITGRQERGSEPVLGYIQEHQPKLHLFGDVHQAQATTWRVGRTRCLNLGYFRATGRFLRIDTSGVQPGRVG